MSGHEKTRAAVLAALMVVSVFGATVAFSGAAAAEDVNMCRTISEPGNYELTDDIDTSQSTCIQITSSNVVFDGNGHEITHFGSFADAQEDPGNNEEPSGGAIVAGSQGPRSNITVKDTVPQNWDTSVNYDGVSGGTITDIDAQRSTFDGIAVFDSERIDVSDNHITDPAPNGGEVYGFDVQDSSEIDITNNEVNANSGPDQNDVLGIGVFGSDGIDANGNTLKNNGEGGVFVVGSADSTFSNNNLQNNQLGFYVGFGSSNNEITNNLVTGSAEDGVGLYSGANNNTVEDNTLTDNTNNGVVVDGSSTANNEIRNNELEDNTDSGVNLNDGANNNTVADNTIRHNGYGDDNEERSGVELVAPLSGGDGADDNTVTDNRIVNNSRFGVLVGGDTTDGNLVYDNFLSQSGNDDSGSDGNNIGFAQGAADDDGDNEFNVDPTDEENIIGGDQTGGNFYAQPGDAEGFSEKCQNNDNNSFCDGAADLDGDGDFNDETSDQYPLTNETADNVSAPDTVDFGEVVVGTNENRTVTFTNEGDDPVSLGIENDISEENPDYTVYGDTSKQTLGPGESRSVTVGFNPDSLGNSSTGLFYSSNASNGNGNVHLTGEGVAGGGGGGQGNLAAPSSEMYGDVTVGESSDHSVTLVNDGDAPIEVTETAIRGPDGAQFDVVDNPAGSDDDGESFTLDADESRDLTVRFTPESEGPKSATLYSDTANDGSQQTELSGNGVEEETPPPEESGPRNNVTIVGEGPRTTYVLSVTDDLEKSTDMGANINANDEIRRDYVADGVVGQGSDSYRFNGSLETIKVRANDDAEVYVNGVRMSDEEVRNQPANALEFEGTGPRATYAFSTTTPVPLQKVTANNANINANDHVFRTSANGVIGSRTDSYGFYGAIDSLNLDGPGNVYVNGRAKDPDTKRDHVITVVGTGDRAEYSFSGASDVQKSVANYANINANDEVTGDGASGVVGSASDSFVYNGDISEFTATDDVQVYIDGEQIDQGSVGS